MSLRNFYYIIHTLKLGASPASIDVGTRGTRGRMGRKGKRNGGTKPALPRQESNASSVHDGVAIGAAPKAGTTAVSRMSTTILKNVKEWWDTRKKTEGNVPAGGNEIDEEEVILRSITPRSTIPERAAPVDTEDMSMAMVQVHESASTGQGLEEITVAMAILPSASTVKAFARQTMDRAREQQKSHSEYVAWLRENRLKARPIATAKSYDRVRRWWMVYASSSALSNTDLNSTSVLKWKSMKTEPLSPGRNSSIS